MIPEGRIAQHFRRLAELAERMAREASPEIEALADQVLDTLSRGGKLLFCGNGGSAADAQHLAAEYLVRFRRDRRPLPALALTTDTSVLTATANDRGFETVFARQVEALGSPGDLLLVHSTTGDSENLVRAVDAARRRGVRTAALLAGDGGRLRERVDWALVVPTGEVPLAQEIHLAVSHVVCELVEEVVEDEDLQGRREDA